MGLDMIIFPELKATGVGSNCRWGVSEKKSHGGRQVSHLGRQAFGVRLTKMGWQEGGGGRREWSRRG